MTRAVTCIGSLQRFLDLSLTAEAISEAFLSFPASTPTSTARSELEEHSFDVAGIRDEDSGRVHRCVRIEALTASTCGDCAEEVRLEEAVARSTPLRDCLVPVVEHGRVFVLGRSGIEGIITRADLGKQPVRLLLFGVISTLEMAMLELIRQQFPDEGWIVNPEVDVETAQEIFDRRAARNEEIDLADCLQIGDKATVLIECEGIVDAWGFSSEDAAREVFERIRRLRNNVAHAHDPTSGSNWDDVVSLLDRAQEVLARTTSLLQGEGSPESTEIT